MKNKGQAGMDFIHAGRAYGSVAARLLNNGMDINQLRNNDVLLYDEWKDIDRAVLMAYQQRLVGVADLMSRGLVYNIGNGLGKTVLGYQDASDIEDAQMSMDGVTRGKKDRPEFDISYLPLPVTHADFSFSAREIEASRSGNMPLDTTMAELAARKVAEKIETTLFAGASTYTFGGGTIYGYLDEPNRNTVAITVNWDDSGNDPLEDVLNMKQALIDDRCYGPYILYIPTNWETSIDYDLKAASDVSIRERILKISGLQDVKVADKLTSDYPVMVQMTSDVIRMVNGMNVTTIQWETDGGMMVHFKVMAIQVPQTRHDQTGRCGIVVGT